MPQSPASPEIDAPLGTLSASDVGRLIDVAVGANVAVLNRDLRFLYVNAQYAKTRGIPREKLIGHTMFELNDALQMREIEPYFRRALAGEALTYERLARIEGLGDTWHSVSVTPTFNAANEVVGALLVSTRVHELKVHSEALRSANERLTSHMENSPLAMLELDNRLNIAHCSAQFRSLIGIDPDAVINTAIFDALRQCDAQSTLAQALARLQAGLETRNRVEVALRHASGATVHSEWFNSALTDAEGRISSIMSLVQDTTARTLAEAKLLEIAMRDPLTGLSNRRALTDRIERAVQSADIRLSLLLIDLDGFKPINDAHGHAVGDQVLCEVARRLSDLTRREDTVARIGGDEFVLLIKGEISRESMAEFALRIMCALEATYWIDDVRVQISASIGVAQSPPLVANAMELLRQADTAMYAAKRAAKARVHFALSQATSR